MLKILHETAGEQLGYASGGGRWGIAATVLESCSISLPGPLATTLTEHTAHDLAGWVDDVATSIQ